MACNALTATDMETLQIITNRIRSRLVVRTGRNMPDPDNIRYGLTRYQSRLPRMITYAKELIERAFEATSAWYVSCSFGKDSLVLLHMLTSMRPWLPVVWVDRGIANEPPDIDPTVEAYREHVAKFTLIRITPPYSTMDYYYDMGGIPDEKSNKKGGIAMLGLERPIQKWMHMQNIQGTFLGRRMEESQVRRMRISSVGGLAHIASTNVWHCDPLMQWNAADVWAYIWLHDLPYPPTYDIHPQGREKARIASWNGFPGASYGRFAELKVLYPELFQFLANKFPDVRRFV